MGRATDRVAGEAWEVTRAGEGVAQGHVLGQDHRSPPLRPGLPVASPVAYGLYRGLCLALGG